MIEEARETPDSIHSTDKSNNEDEGGNGDVYLSNHHRQSLDNYQ